MNLRRVYLELLLHKKFHEKARLYKLLTIDRQTIISKRTQVDRKLLEDISWICLKFKVRVANLLVDEMCLGYSNKAQIKIKDKSFLAADCSETVA